jgi:GAF domain-containing protein
LRSDSLDEVLNEACRLAAEGLDADLAKILEIEEGGERVLVRAGVGWKPGRRRGEALFLGGRVFRGLLDKAGHPIVTAHIEKENRFRFADLLIEHGVAALVNAPSSCRAASPTAFSKSTAARRTASTKRTSRSCAPTRPSSGR